jgi:hypothetical protein
MTNHKTSATGHAVTTVIAAVAALIGPAAIAQTLPADAFAALPAMESPAISADGKRLAFISATPTESFILVANLDDMQVTTVVQVNEGKLRGVFWANDAGLVVTASTTTSAPLIPGRIETAAP